jgi:hypothetical protein
MLLDGIRQGVHQGKTITLVKKVNKTAIMASFIREV